MFFNVIVGILTTIMIPFWLSIFTPEVGEKVAIVVSPTR